MKITLIFVGVLVLFSATLAAAVLHGVTSVSILERLRELATLRSLGFSAAGAAWIASLEVFTMASLGLLLGIPAGIWMNNAFLKVYNTESFSFGAVHPPWMYGATIGLVWGLVALSLAGGLRQLHGMDLAQATKAQE